MGRIKQIVNGELRGARRTYGRRVKKERSLPCDRSEEQFLQNRENRWESPRERYELSYHPRKDI